MTQTPIAHTDSIQPNNCDQSESYTTSTSYSNRADKEEYGSVAERGSEIELRHPAPDISTLILKTHLEAQLHAANRAQWGELTDEPNDGGLLYDLKISEVLDETMAIEGNPVDDLDIPYRRLQAIFITNARELSSIRARRRYLQASPRVCAMLGYESVDDIPSWDTFRAELNERLPEELDGGIDALRRACIRAIYSVYRNGIVPPSTVATTYGFDDLAPPLDERSVNRWIKQQALRNWIRLLKRRTLQPLTFGRKRPQFTMFQFLGVFATSASTGAGFRTVPDVSDWDLDPPPIPVEPGEQKYVELDRSAIPKGSGLPKYIDSLPLHPQEAALSTTDVPAITTQFDAVHRDFLSVAQDRGFFRNKSFSLASDIFRIEWTGSEDAPTINRPKKKENDVRSEWTFAIVSILNNEARFSLGTRVMRKKSEYPTKLGEILPITTDYFETDKIYADSEIVGGDLIETMNSHADSDFVIKAPDHDRVEALKALTPRNHVGFVPKLSWNSDPKPNLVAYPDDSSYFSLVTFTPRQIDTVASSDWPDSTDLPDSSTDLSDFTTDNNTDDHSFPESLGDKFDWLRSQPGVGTKSNHESYLTSCTKSELFAEEVHSKYYQRWGVEENINEVSNEVLARIESAKPKLRFYGANIAILLENWHTLINRAPSPELGLRLSVTHSELLDAIQNLAFS